MTAMLDHAGMIEAGEKTIADRDAEIETLKHKAQGLHRVADKLAVTVEGLEAELADVRMKHEASRKRASDLEAKRVATVNGLQVSSRDRCRSLRRCLGKQMTICRTLGTPWLSRWRTQTGCRKLTSRCFLQSFCE